MEQGNIVGNRWKVIERIGGGGQGTVHKVEDLNKTNERHVASEIEELLRRSRAAIGTAQAEGLGADFYETLAKAIDGRSTKSQFGALKMIDYDSLRKGKEKDKKKEEARVTNEIETLKSISLSNIVKVLDDSGAPEWFVMEFFPFQDLTQWPLMDEYTGNVLATLEAIRPLVSAVSLLHRRDLVHRDIKPLNIFFDFDRGLVLGDFGLVFDIADIKKRETSPKSVAGSWQWMPAWLQHARDEVVKPNIDVHCLAKVIWWMLQDQHDYLPNWYFEDEDYPEYNLVKMFPDKPEMDFVNSILRESIVERESNCKLPDASALLKRIDEVISKLKSGADGKFWGKNPNRPCLVCGRGEYLLRSDTREGRPGSTLQKSKNFGLEPTPDSENALAVYSCEICGHVQFFHGGKDGRAMWD